MLARPAEFPQVTPDEHLGFVGVADLEAPVRRLPRSPRAPVLDRDLRTARLHPLIHRCRDCHAGRLDERLRGRRPIRPSSSATTATPRSRPTSPSCRTSRCAARLPPVLPGIGFAGRILRDADPRFCLLCHRAATIEPGRRAGHRLARTSRPDGSARRARPPLRRLPPGPYPPSPAGQDGRTVIGRKHMSDDCQWSRRKVLKALAAGAGLLGLPSDGYRGAMTPRRIRTALRTGAMPWTRRAASAAAPACAPAATRTMCRTASSAPGWSATGDDGRRGARGCRQRHRPRFAPQEDGGQGVLRAQDLQPLREIGVQPGLPGRRRLPHG